MNTDIEKLLVEDVHSILNMDVDSMSKSELSKFWQKHLRLLDNTKVTQKDVSNMRKEIFKNMNCEDEYNYKLSSLQSKLLRGGR